MILVQYKRFANSRQMDTLRLGDQFSIREANDMLNMAAEAYWVDVVVNYRFIARKCYGSQWHCRLGNPLTDDELCCLIVEENSLLS